MASDVRTNITRTGRIVGVLCTVARVFVIVVLVLCIAGIAVLYAGFDFAQPVIGWAVDFSFGKQIVDGLSEFAELPPRDVLGIQLLITVLSQVFLLLVLNTMHAFVCDISAGDRPFQVSTARKLRHRSWLMLLLMFMHPAVALVGLFLALFLSYLIEYGAQLQEQADETSRIQEEMIFLLAEVTESKSGQTGQHVRRVSEYTRVLADELGLPAADVDELRVASIMHDIGKLLVPTEILDKPGRLTDEEFAIIKRHTTDGGALLENVEGDTMQLARTVALDHHERWDGRGYAQGKAAEDISFEGRIVAVADVYDALTSKRSYKDAWDGKEAYDEIVRCAGTQFDPQVVEAFKRRYNDIDRGLKSLVQVFRRNLR